MHSKIVITQLRVYEANCVYMLSSVMMLKFAI